MRKSDTLVLALVFQTTLTLNLKMKLTIWLNIGSVIEDQKIIYVKSSPITGSGPAFLYHVFEQYVKAGKRNCLEKNKLKNLYQTLL